LVDYERKLIQETWLFSFSTEKKLLLKAMFQRATPAAQHIKNLKPVMLPTRKLAA
jgi:hypothetical protein